LSPLRRVRLSPAALPLSAMFNFRFGLKRWRVTKPIYGLLLSETPFIIAGLALYGIADPNTYRSRLWQDGFDNGFNSSPAQPIYDMVNGGKGVVPLVWSL
jgi:hypothetical protein